MAALGLNMLMLYILLDWAEGRSERIEELEEPVLTDLNQTWRHADSYMRTY